MRTVFVLMMPMIILIFATEIFVGGLIFGHAPDYIGEIRNLVWVRGAIAFVSVYLWFSYKKRYLKIAANHDKYNHGIRKQMWWISPLLIGAFFVVATVMFT